MSDKQLSARDVHKMELSKVVDNVEWKALRKAMIGHWKDNPIRNVGILRGYLDQKNDPLKVRRVQNYLSGTAFSIGKINHPDIDVLYAEVNGVWNKMMADDKKMPTRNRISDYL